MGYQRISPKKTARWARTLELPIIRAWAKGGYDFTFVTDDHRHGRFNIKTLEVTWTPNAPHFTSCPELFGSNEPSERSERENLT